MLCFRVWPRCVFKSIEVQFLFLKSSLFVWKAQTEDVVSQCADIFTWRMQLMYERDPQSLDYYIIIREE